MLGDFTRDQSEQECQYESSTMVASAIKEYWKGDGWVQNVTLDPQEEIWKEWWIGASGLHNVCPRMYALMCACGYAGELKAEKIDAGSLWNFEQGHLYHELFQYRILPSFPKSMLLGQWGRIVPGKVVKDANVVKDVSGVSTVSQEMTKEVTRFENDVPPGVVLDRGWGPKPDGKGWKYEESKLRIPEYRVVVKIDGIVDWGDGELEVQEIKTEKQSANDDLNPMLGGRPRQKHIEQVQLALLATGLKKGRIIYVFKGADYLNGAMIEYIIPRDDMLIERIKARLKESVDTVRQMHDERDGIVLAKHGDKLIGEGCLFERLDDEKKKEIGCLMKPIAQKVEKLPECKLKSKGRPKYCPGRDLCFGVRKKKCGK